MGGYIPNTPEEQKQMLKEMGCESFLDIYKDIPSHVLIKKGQLKLPEGLSEFSIRREMEKTARKNIVFDSVFRGAGAYKHYIPAIVKSIVSKEEFITAYTPYQAEISQGILQSIFEYQTMICMLTGMDASNASLYDGATAAAEAVNMCVDKKRHKAFVSATSHPHVIETIKTYCFGSQTEMVLLPEKDGKTDISALSEIDKSCACVYIQQPNFYGLLEDISPVEEAIHAAGGKLIIGCHPISLAVLKTPGEYGADISVGEGQPLGMPLSFGGPYIGFLACKEKLVRRMPGRIVGQTTDVEGKRAFVLTLQAREQHIKREKADSNVCSNQALCALTAAAYLSAMGKEGLKQAAIQCMSKAQYFAKELCAIKGFHLEYTGEFFNEFVTNCPVDCEKLMEKLESEGILGGYPISGGKQILWCVTECNTKEEIDFCIAVIKKEAEKI